MPTREPRREFDGYRLVRLLGKGGMGEVHLAEDTILDRPVAIKFISQGADDPSSNRRFLAEARAIARLQHPNVVSIYRVGEVDGHPYLVSEFIRGTPLDALPRPVTPELAVRIASDIAHGLAAAHNRGVVHRDIKPANAILSEDGEVKLLDFGIAKLVGQVETPSPVTSAPADAGESADSTARIALEEMAAAQEQALTKVGTIMGTPRYLAPEVWAGGPATFRSDVYSVGALLYFLCAGEPPHTAPDLPRLKARVLGVDATPLAEAAPSVDPALAAIVDRCLRRDPAARFASGGELRAALVQLGPAGRDRIIPDGNPYRGLQAFDAEHQSFFFGRDSEIRMILERLVADPFVLVTGDSGIGKSSLCKAGVIPRVERWLGAGRAWSAATLVPGRYPAQALAVVLAPLCGMDEEQVTRRVIEDPGGLARALRAALGETRGLLLCVDQLEELATLADPEAAAAVSEALGWLVVPSPSIRVLATVRGDFLSRVANLPRLGDEVSRALYFLRPLSAERIRDAIVGPAQIKGVSFESRDFVDELVISTEAAHGGLPLLEFALTEMWETLGPSDKVVTRAALRAVGGVSGALGRHADGVLSRMLPQVREAARRVLSSLVTADGTRARRTDAELGAIDPHVRAAVDGLVRGRLLVARDTPAGPGLEIAHETLITGWPTLAAWLSEDADARMVRERLRNAVSEWVRLGRSRDVLWSARQIREARGLDRTGLTSVEAAFLLESVRVRRTKLAARIAAAAGVPLLVAAAWAVMTFQESRDLAARVDREVIAARGFVQEARKIQIDAGSRKTKALSLFDAGRAQEAEQAWASFRAVEGKLQPILGKASGRLETALSLSWGREDARTLTADVLFERAKAAEAAGQQRLVEEYLGRMALFDKDGARGRLWSSPARVSLIVKPADARVELQRYVTDDRGRLVLERVKVPNGLAGGVDLPAGSYLARLSAPGHSEVSHPFVIGRGETARFTVSLPLAKDVPGGFAYVPPGRFLFGSAADDGLRRDFFHTAPVHAVTTRGYLVALHETTFADWIAYLTAMPPAERASRAPHAEKGGFQGALSLGQDRSGAWKLSIQPTARSYEAAAGQPILYPSRDRRARQDWLRFPVSGVTAAEAEAYAMWLDRSGRVRGARLCTDLEWERAARGADGREYPHGAALAPDDANHDATYNKDPLGMGPDEVGAHPASRSPFGLDDAAGNVWEWVDSSFEKGGHAARGGSWAFGANSSRSTDREITEPAFRDISVGVRICADGPSR
ncbi:MAG: SUMF1/EgtB/PvdO family nonheme iron enzyme [Deltaproteobacteria bacterium]|nr:SUMF1/EgtB/PvdO family nonheme iron enzyme [Deltaproteobacteria bacterium]